MVNRSLILFCILLLVALSAASQHCVENRYSQDPLFEASQIVQHANIVYGNATHLFSGNNVTLEMDIFEPDPAIDPVSLRPLIVLIHGGSFQSGSRSDMNTLCIDMARRGFVTATISYRLGWECDPNAGALTCLLCGDLDQSLLAAAYAAGQDARAALRFLVHNDAQYGIDSNWIFAGGVSAGAITALSVAFMDQAEADALLPEAVALAGGLDDAGNELTETFSIKAVINDCGAVFNTSVIDAIEDVPVISFHDEFDCVVPYGNGHVIGCLGCTAFPIVSGSSLIHDQLLQNGTCSELNTYQLSLLHCGWPQGNIVLRSACFLKRVMCGVCTSAGNNQLNAWSPCEQLSLPVVDTGNCPSDLNGDGVINTGDLVMLLADFGSVCE